jgi:phosphoenolpyruvate carboxykinase (ATP)
MSAEQTQIASAAATGAAELENYGIRDAAAAHWNIGVARLVEHAIRRREGCLSRGGSLTVRTGQFTGRSPKDKFVVDDESTRGSVDWGAVNQPLAEAGFERIYQKVLAFWKGREVYVQDCFAGADPAYTLPIRIFSQYAWHGLFAHQLFIRPAAGQVEQFQPQFTLMFVPELLVDPAQDGTQSQTAIVLNFKRRIALICGTEYAGEMKKSAFTIMNYLLPDRGVLPMHCSANLGASGDVALFFGLSGTGKTTLSADPDRKLIGDDEHGWSDQGVFNFEGGCYAKCIRLSREHEPQIWDAIRFGTVLENVAIDEHTRELNFNSQEITENTRAAYPLEYIDNAVFPSVGDHPRNVVFLTADAFGVLPPISSLTPEQAMYHFLSGYTAKVAGTERGLGSEPEATFSACFGSPFLPRAPHVYARLLGEKLHRHEARCWLVNTGWVGGPYGVGARMKLAYTRAMLKAALSGALRDIPMSRHPVFKLMYPQFCPDVPSRFLDARGMWRDQAAYDRAAAALAGRFNKNFEKFSDVPAAIAEAAPSV